MNHIDCHFHLDLQPNPQKCAEEIEEAKIYTIAVTNSPKVFFYTNNLSTGKKYIRPALGLHPELAFQRKGEIQQFKQLLPQTKYIGEVGLDNSRKTKEDYLEQKRIFGMILVACAEYKDKILTIHSRWAASDTISMIGNKFPGKIIMHWFSGTLKELDLAIESGFYFSINNAMIKSENGRNIIRGIPSDRILTETDGPFVKENNIPLTPLGIRKTIETISLIRPDIGNAEKISNLIYYNFKTIISVG